MTENEIDDNARAAACGYASAQFNLGVMYATGQGVTKDEPKAVEWYKKSAEQNQMSCIRVW